MSSGANHHSEFGTAAVPDNGARVRAMTLWLGRLLRFREAARTEGANGPAAIRLRAELQAGLPGVLAGAEPLTLRFSGREVLCGSNPLLLERSTKEALLRLASAGGVRSLRLSPVLPAAEFDGFLLTLVRAGDDLSPGPGWGALLRESALPHVGLEISTAETPVAETTSRPVRSPARTETAPQEGIRSDDWTGGVATILPDRPLMFPAEPPPAVAELRAAYLSERGRTLVRAALDAVRPCVELAETPEERSDFRQFLLRALRFALVSHAWEDGQEVIDLLRSDPGASADADAIASETLGGGDPEELAAALDGMSPERVRAYVDLVRRFEAIAPEVLTRAMAESNERRHRRLFAQALSEICRPHPARLEPGLADPRWYVVRNIVFVLGLIGGDVIVPHLKRVVRHPERRVRRQCLVALGTVSPAAARPLLFAFLLQNDAEFFRGALEMLTARRDPFTAAKLLELLQDPAGDGRSPDERLALSRAVAATADETLLSRLAELLVEGKVSPRAGAPELLVLAETVVRLGGAAGREVLQQGEHSRNGLIRGACTTALSEGRADG